MTIPARRNWGLRKAAIAIALIVLAFAAPAPIARDFDAARMPRLVLWAWERPEDLRRLPSEVGVAFLAQTVTLQNHRFEVQPRRQQLLVNPRTPLIAVTRIESRALNADDHDEATRNALAQTIGRSAALSGATAIQMNVASGLLDDGDTIPDPTFLPREELNAAENEITQLDASVMRAVISRTRPSPGRARDAARSERGRGAFFDRQWLAVGVRGRDDGSPEARHAFTTLHRLFPNSEWAAKTKYWYR